MGDQLSISEQGAPALARSRAEAAEIARARVLNPHAPNTQRAYRQAFARWTSYCDAHGMLWAPIEPGALCTYLEGLTRQGLAPNTVRLHFAALCELDMASRITPTDQHPRTLREHPAVQRWQESWSRDNPRAPRRRAAALEPSDLERLLAAAAEPRRHAARTAHLQRYVRDRCLILFGVCGALRGADLAELELADIESTDRGVRVRVRRSKTDQSGQGDVVGLMAQGRVLLCPVDAWRAWRTLRGDTPGPLFVGISRSAELELGRALSERQITRLVGEYAARAGLPHAISAHSLRATFATLATARGKSLARVMQHGRWRSAEIAATYVRQGELFADNASSGLLD